MYILAQFIIANSLYILVFYLTREVELYSPYHDWLLLVFLSIIPIAFQSIRKKGVLISLGLIIVNMGMMFWSSFYLLESIFKVGM